MIIRETDEAFILIRQHDHAVISGILSEQWKDEWFTGENYRKSVNYAIKQHDWCWQDLDKRPIYMENLQKPASFINYPLNEKIKAYRFGVDQMALEDKYAALLISKHYSSFFQGDVIPEGLRFRKEEQERQVALCESSSGNEALEFHFELLQLCDNLSLYICMNEWGVEKKNEMEWFKNGFPQKVLPSSDDKIMAEWVNEHKVKLTPYPFSQQGVQVKIPYKKIKKEQFEITGIKQVLEGAEDQYHTVTFQE